MCQIILHDKVLICLLTDSSTKDTISVPGFMCLGLLFITMRILCKWTACDKVGSYVGIWLTGYTAISADASGQIRQDRLSLPNNIPICNTNEVCMRVIFF